VAKLTDPVCFWCRKDLPWRSKKEWYTSLWEYQPTLVGIRVCSPKCKKRPKNELMPNGEPVDCWRRRTEMYHKSQIAEVA